MCPDACHFVECVVDLVWLPKDDSSLFVADTTPRRAVLPPDWPFMAVSLDFSRESTAITLGKRERCISGGCSVCNSCVLGTYNNEAAASGWDLKFYNK